MRYPWVVVEFTMIVKRSCLRAIVLCLNLSAENVEGWLVAHVVRYVVFHCHFSLTCIVV